MTPIPWEPVADHGCGWRDCPLCGPKIEEELEAKHRKRVLATFPRRDDAARVSEFIGEIYGTGEERGAKIISLDERRATQGERNWRKEIVRVQRTLTAEERTQAAAIIVSRPVRRERLKDGGLPTWLSEVWLELLNPTVRVGERERQATLEEKVRKAIQRAEDRIKRQNQESARYLPTWDMLQK